MCTYVLLTDYFPMFCWLTFSMILSNMLKFYFQINIVSQLQDIFPLIINDECEMVNSKCYWIKKQINPFPLFILETTPYINMSALPFG